MALVCCGGLISGTSGKICANVINLISNVAIKLRMLSTKQVDGFTEVTKLVINLRLREFIEAILALIFRHLVKLGQCLLVLVLSMQDVGGFYSAVLLCRLVRVQECECLVELSLLDQTDKLSAAGASCLLAICLGIKDHRRLN